MKSEGYKPMAFESIKKIKTTTKLMEAYNHNFRVGDKAANVATDKSHLNEELIILQERDYRAAFNEIIANNNITPRKNAVLAVEVLLEAKNIDEDFDLDAWKKQSAEWVQAYFGKDNVISAVYHGDESEPHIHAIVVPVVDGKLRSCEFTNGKAKLSAMQTSYANAVRGLGLERGMERTPVKYEDMQKFRSAAGKVAKESLPTPAPTESVDDYYERANDCYQEANIINFRKQNELRIQAEKEIELAKREAESKITEAIQKTEAAQEQVREIQKSIKPLVDENSDLKKKVDELSVELELQRKEFSRYLKEGISESDMKRLTNLNKVFSALSRGLLGESTAEKKDAMMSVMNEALDAYNEAERNRGGRMDDREENGLQDGLDAGLTEYGLTNQSIE